MVLPSGKPAGADSRARSKPSLSTLMSLLHQYTFFFYSQRFLLSSCYLEQWPSCCLTCGDAGCSFLLETVKVTLQDTVHGTLRLHHHCCTKSCSPVNSKFSEAWLRKTTQQKNGRKDRMDRKRHNRAREMHKLPPLRPPPGLSISCQDAEWGRTLPCDTWGGQMSGKISDRETGSDTEGESSLLT